ncbi:MAG: aminotransferase class V-fold PLP-dependent enzyme [Oligoflexia bacterium]|nr:aminotransferase class V-fold PLP-dependent enzyme [Oligoflexia bacterium]
MKKIYADYNASTPLHPEVIKYLHQRLDLNLWANPNSAHQLGKMLMTAINKCRLICSEILGIEAGNLIFTSGASEGIATIFHAICANKNLGRNLEKNILVISAIEHPAVKASANYYKNFGYKVIEWPVNSNGEIEIEFIKSDLDNIKDKIALIAVMYANNECGVIEPIENIGEFCQQHAIPFFSDTTQYIAKEDFNFNKLPIDFAVLSAHKFAGPLGVGALLVKPAYKNFIKENALIFGGGQEFALRAGTQNYLGIEAMCVALSASVEESRQTKNLFHKFRLQFENELTKKYKKIVILGGDANRRLSQTTLLSYPGIYGPLIQQELESKNIFVSTSAACSEQKEKPSPSLSSSLSSLSSLSSSSIQSTANTIANLMGFSDDVARGMVRISLGGIKENEIDEIYQKIYSELVYSIDKLSKIGSY